MPRVKGFEYEPYGSIPAGIENSAVSDSKTYSGVKGFIPDESGTLAVDMVDGSSGTMTVVAGLQYASQVTKFKLTGTVTVANVTIFY